MVKLAQRYSRAVTSGNLKSDEFHFDTDVLAALALSSSFGGLMFRVKYCNDVASFQKLQDHWTWIVSTKAVRRNWPVHVPIEKVAYISLKRWLNSVCPACTGRMKLTIFNTPSLSDKNCPLCDGTGQAELRCNPALRDYILDMIEELHADERKAGARAAKKLGKHDDDVKNYMPAQKGV